jgi:hypothetical protein
LFQLRVSAREVGAVSSKVFEPIETDGTACDLPNADSGGGKTVLTASRNLLGRQHSNDLV